jgi:threonine synthase
MTFAHVFSQTMVKELFNDNEFLLNIQKQCPDLQLSSANSINWARFLPQIVFTISAYVQLIEQKTIRLGEPIDICIPTGNFGNMLGALYARRLGLPIRHLITASNENKIIADFIRTGSYDLRHRSFQKTISPSIDILISSNLERLLYLFTHGNSRMIRKLFEQLAEQRYFHIDESLLKNIQQEIQGDWANEEQCLTMIRQVYNETKQLIDPHTAVAVHVADKYTFDEHVPMLISATAHYGKFPQTIFKALNYGEQQLSNDMTSLLNNLQELDSISSMHKELMKLPNKLVRHTTMVPASKSAIVNEIEVFLNAFSRQYSS